MGSRADTAVEGGLGEAKGWGTPGVVGTPLSFG